MDKTLTLPRKKKFSAWVGLDFYKQLSWIAFARDGQNSSEALREIVEIEATARRNQNPNLYALFEERWARRNNGR